MSETFSFSEAIADAMPTVPEPAKIIGFWRRLLAFIIDSLILGIVGFSIGILFFDTLAALGGWGKLVGFFIALLYFGILNSAVGSGQTLGKRLTNIKVIDRNGGLISLHRSFFRYTVLGTPFFLNGAMLSPSVQSLAIGFGLIIFGVGFAIIYLYIFNRRTHQSLHDLAAGTLVVRATDVVPPPDVRIWKYHLIIASAGSVLVLAISLVMSFWISQRFALSDLYAVQQSIQDSGKVHTSSVFVGTVWANNGETQYLNINAFMKERPQSFKASADEIADLVMKNYPEIANKDVLAVSMIYGFDIGIASSWQSYNFNYSPGKWKQKLAPQINGGAMGSAVEE